LFVQPRLRFCAHIPEDGRQAAANVVDADDPARWQRVGVLIVEVR
jgi:hypothetical protein